jgi:predicted extracellular nuclease
VNCRKTVKALVAAAALSAVMGTAHAEAVGMKISEWMYQGAGDTSREFIEFTNYGPVAIDMTGWSFDDASNTAGSLILSSFGVVNPGESVILAEQAAADFRAAWGLSATVDVIGGNGQNLGRADAINLYDSSGTLVDRLAYDDQAGQGPRTRGVSANPGTAAELGANTANLWVLSAVGDAYGSYASSFGDVANPGTSSFAETPAPVPLPAAAWLLISGIGALGAMKRRVRAA